MSKFSRKEVKQFYKLYKDKTIVVREGGEIKALAIYFAVDDKTIDMIKDKKLDLSKPENTNYCFKQEGDNIHFIMVISNNIKHILTEVRKVMKTAKTVSWFSPDMTRFFITEGSLCHQ